MRVAGSMDIVGFLCVSLAARMTKPRRQRCDGVILCSTAVNSVTFFSALSTGDPVLYSIHRWQ